MLSLTGFAAEMERERAKQRTYDAMLRKAKTGHVTGGKSTAMTTRMFPLLTAAGYMCPGGQ